jgi:putative phage-type endonuclease
MLLGELEDLVDVLDDIIPEEDVALISTEEEEDIINTTVLLLTDYIDENPSAVSEPDFHDIMIENVKELLFMHFDNFFATNADLEDELDDIIDIAVDFFYMQIIPRRSYNDTFETRMSEKERERIKARLIELANVPQSAQRTKEWYETRHRLITASNAYKAFENESARNQLIFEKCQPLLIEDLDAKSEAVNTTTAMHHGQKYEPVSIMYYEDCFGTKVSEYGCIQHNTYKFLGASPDGIVSDPSLPRFGRMLEIKNIVNREIDGIPKKEYWIQMQLQQETCDLNECDFLETRFVEYVSHSDFKADGTFLTSEKGERKGIIMYFSSPEGKPKYVYKPLNMVEEYYDSTWEPEQIAECEKNGLTWIKNIYWRLEEVSCVLVLRNRKWFQDNIGELASVWDTILKERDTGFAHRAPAKRAKKDAQQDSEMEEVCLLNFDKLTGKVTVAASANVKTSRSNSFVDGPFFKVRTESFDETKNKVL